MSQPHYQQTCYDWNYQNYQKAVSEGRKPDANRYHNNMVGLASSYPGIKTSKSEAVELPPPPPKPRPSQIKPTKVQPQVSPPTKARKKPVGFVSSTTEATV